MRERIVARLRGTVPSAGMEEWRLAGMSREQSWRLREHFPAHPVPAAVLVPIVDHPTGLTVLLTQRSEALRKHGGQISFPGGRIESADAGPLAAALRETREEIGLEPAQVRVLGFLPDHLIGTGFRVTPVVAFVDPGFSLKLDAREVTGTFEVPLEHVFDPHNHKVRLRRVGDIEIEMYDIPYEGRHIWGATAGMLMTFCGLMTGPAP
jgi:8-oxo-dGTP pyrophosphatase MutT (NUDIX family)